MKAIEYIDRASAEIRREIVPGEGWLKWLYHNPMGKLALHGVVKRQLVSRLYGWRMDSPASRAKIPEFVRTLGIDMDEATKPMEAYESFNDFFVRELKPEARPMDPAEDAIVSPADGKILAFEGLTGLESFFVKGQRFSLRSFLRDDALAERYAGGTLLIVRLAPVDYHRFHFPAAGHISASRLVNGAYYSVSPYAVKARLSVYWENKRALSRLTTKNAGEILLSEVAATMVGAIVQTYAADSQVKKGQEKGMFKFGGSTVIMLLEKDKARVDSDIVDNTRRGYETTIKLGEHLATAAG